MAQDCTTVRQNIVRSEIALVTRILEDMEAVVELRNQKVQMGTNGNFVDADFSDVAGLTHVTPQLASGGLDAINTALTALEAANPGTNYLRQLKA
jgi:hypothetical protein